MFSKVKTLLNDTEHRHTAINAAIALVIRVLGAGMAFFFNLIIARQLGAEEAGYFFLSLALAMLLSAIANLGFENTVLRFSSANIRSGSQKRAILNFALKFSVPLACIFTMTVIYLAPIIATIAFNKPELTSSLQYIAPSIVAISILFLVAMSLQARQKVVLSISSQNITHFIICGAAVVLFKVESASSAALYFSLSVGLSSCFFYCLSARKFKLDYIEQLDGEKLWQSARANWVVVIMTQAVQWSAPIIIGVFLVAEQVAFFSVAQRIALLTAFILMAVNLVVAPKFSAFHSKGDDVGIRKTALFSVRLLVLSALPIVLFMLLFPEFLMGLFGEEFKQGALILQILVLGQAVNVVSGSVGLLLQMTGHERDMRLVTLISGFGVLISVPIFTKLFGAVGAATATAFFISLQNLLAVYFVKKRLGFNTLMFWQKI